MKGLAVRLIDANTPSPGNHIYARNCFVSIIPFFGYSSVGPYMIEFTMYAGCI